MVVDVAQQFWRRSKALNRCASPEEKDVYREVVIREEHDRAVGKRKELLARLLVA